ncbi:hypothetical protein FZEAL_9397 [Fusarium zealandicum]|uniref:BTB domain-containing protein n=1 Tax=Fusarium zealandicum TaxID=1053134 RepID=A0A8H4UBK8_9HYPO|nr:hypothetical protein FZEAL_9397 [Fusarium zealandicum]
MPAVPPRAPQKRKAEAVVTVEAKRAKASDSTSTANQTGTATPSAREETSFSRPYLSGRWRVIFSGKGDDQAHDVPAVFIKKHPGFAAKFLNGGKSFGGKKPLDMPNLSESTKHVLLHFLYTDTYQTLNRDVADKTGEVKHLATAVHVYGMARDYGLTALETLATFEIEKLAKTMKFIDMVKFLDLEEFSKTNMGGWLHPYLATRAKEECNPPSTTKGNQMKNARVEMDGSRLLTCVLCETIGSLREEVLNLRFELDESY